MQKKRFGPTVSYHEHLIEYLRKDASQAIGYLNASLELGDPEAFLIALRNVLEAQGGMTKFSRSTKINRVSLYKMLSKSGNPGFQNIMLLLNALGIKFQFSKKSESKPRKKAA